MMSTKSSEGAYINLMYIMHTDNAVCKHCSLLPHAQPTQTLTRCYRQVHANHPGTELVACRGPYLISQEWIYEILPTSTECKCGTWASKLIKKDMAFVLLVMQDP